MIKADFTSKEGKLVSFTITGHAGYAEEGYDIVCSAVTSAVQLTANTLTEVYKVKAQVKALDNLIELKLPVGCGNTAQLLLEGLRLHLCLLAEDYEGTVKVNVSEVYKNA